MCPAGVPVWYTAVVPLPAALPDLMQRLRSNYYRQVEALQHDAETIASNAKLYNGEGSDVAKAAVGELLLSCTLDILHDRDAGSKTFEYQVIDSRVVGTQCI